MHVPQFNPNGNCVVVRHADGGPRCIVHRQTATREAVHAVCLVACPLPRFVIRKGVHVAVDGKIQRVQLPCVLALVVDPQLSAVNATAVARAVQPIQRLDAKARLARDAHHSRCRRNELWTGTAVDAAASGGKHPQPRQFRHHRIGDVKPPE